MRWKDGTAIANIHQGELGREGAEDSGHAGFNYGMEPSWFRFKLPPDVPFGNAGTPNSFGSIPNVARVLRERLVVRAERVPYTRRQRRRRSGNTGVPTDGRQADRMHLLNGASADRDATFILHGHCLAARSVCLSGRELPRPGGLLRTGSVGSLALGTNPLGKYMGGEEGMGHVYGHWPILFNAGGTMRLRVTTCSATTRRAAPGTACTVSCG